jgi:hypothetical protein
MLRRALLIVAAGTILVAPPAAAQARSTAGLRPGEQARARALFRHTHGKSPYWFNKRLHNRRAALRLALHQSFRQDRAVSAATDPITVTYAGTGASCVSAASTSNEALGYYETYDTPGGPRYSDVMACIDNRAPRGFSLGPPGNSFLCFDPYAKSGTVGGQCYVASQGDGLEVVVMTVPVDDGSGSISQGGTFSPITPVRQGFGCQATVGTGTNGQTAKNITNTDSLEYYQVHGDFSGFGALAAVTAACWGQLPRSVTPPTTTVTHLVGCSEYNPFPGPIMLRGLGISVTYPGGAYQETCQVPNELLG